MTEYGYSNGRIQPGPRFRSWSLPTESYSTSDPWANSAYFTRREPRRDHVCRPVVVGADGRPTAVQPDPYTVQTNAYRVQPDPYRVQTNAYRVQSEAYLVQPDPYLVQTDAYMVPPANGNGRRSGFPGGLFQRPKPEGYTDGRRAAEPALVTAGGWDRPSPAGWKLPPEGKLGGAAAELVREAAAAAARSPGNGGAKWEAKATEMAMEAVAGKNHAAGGGKGGAKWEATAAELAMEAVAAKIPGEGKGSGEGKWGATAAEMAMEAAKEIAERKAAGKIDSREAIRKYGGQYI